MLRIFTLFILLTSYLSADQSAPLNDWILHYVKSMPTGGGYSLKQNTEDALARSIFTDGKKLLITPKTAKPSYCSSATYLVFLQTINQLITQGALKLEKEELEALRFHDEPDGQGIWGRWNANGPGTAKLFADLKIGINFEDINKAKPGDFMKIFWNEHIGKKEHGHLVIYLSHHRDKDDQQFVKYWSSNQPTGYSIKTIPAKKIHYAIFSRITSYNNLTSISNLPKNDPFLADMLHKSFTRDQVRHATQTNTLEP